MNKISNYIWGLVLVLLGVIIGLNTMGITSINLFFDGWWTLFIIVPCFINLFKDKDKTGSIIGLIIGVSLLLSCLGIMDFSIIWKLLIPIILVIVGLSLIFKDTMNSKVKEEIKKLQNNNGKEYYATFSGQNLEFSNEDFNNCTLNAIFGGIKCDLKKANIKKDTLINVVSVFGGVTIYVPDDVKIKVNSTSIFGGVSNEKKNNKEEKETIYINATCLFGGVEIKWIAFKD